MTSGTGLRVDERDIRWVSERSTFRVTLYTKGSNGYGTETLEFADSRLRDVEEWVGENNHDRRLFQIALVVDDSIHGKGLVVLQGMEPSDFASSATTS